MTQFRTIVGGNLFDSNSEALVNAVNCVGVMGAGVAKHFKQRFSWNYFSRYQYECSTGLLDIGSVTIWKENIAPGKYIYLINFPTKKHWRDPSEYSYIYKGLKSLRNIVIGYDIKSIAIPPLGCGLGGLDWDKVKLMIIAELDSIEDLIVELYEPGR